jgi:hypothetical protein
MPTFIYAPGIKVFIQASRKGIGLVDVSEDLVEGTMIRRSDGVSTFTFSISNPQRKYDAVFAPNDRIVVMMKRLAWVRTYTGLLNSVPLITAWPMVVPLSSSCSLKRLQYWYWDSNAAATQNMIRDALAAVNTQKTNADGGITNVILTILDKVVGWPASKVHIAQIPANWFKIAEQIAKDVDVLAEESDALAADFRKILSDKAIIAGGGTAADGTLNAAGPPPDTNGKLVAGNYGGSDLAGEQLTNAEIIYSICKGLGGSDRDVTIGIMTAMTESSMKNLPGGDRDSVGMFQQRPSQGWGTIAQCTDPNYAAKKFYENELGYGDRDNKDEWVVCQGVQRSFDPSGSNYKKFLGVGRAVTASLTKAIAGGGGKTTSGTSGTGRKGDIADAAGATSTTADPGAKATTGGTPGTSTSTEFAKAGVDLVERYPNIRYGPARRSASEVSANPPEELDCSSFVFSVYLRTLGDAHGMSPQTDAICRWLVSSKAKRLTTEVAFNTPGAVVFVGSWPGSTSHIEICLGDGKSTVGTGSTSHPAKVTDWGKPTWFNFGYELPNLKYAGSTAVTTDGSGAVTGGGAPTGRADTTADQLPGYNANDPIDRLFGNNSWVPQTDEQNAEMALAEALTGVRALLNDQPLLPYLMNLFNSQMRSYCSAPNGDLIAWFPDYYGLWGTAAKMVIEPIELQDFNVQWSDDFFVTHQFTLAGFVNYLQVANGDVNTDFATGGGADITTQTMGIASIDIPAMMYALFGIETSKGEGNAFAKYIYKRFGARPAYNPMPGLQGPKAEFFSAIYMFMRQWAYQYNADIPMTFMPELYPGMLIQIPKFDFQAYVTTVTHSFRFGEGGGFTTSVNVAAPARLPKHLGDKEGVLVGLPMAGDFRPGMDVGNIDPKYAEYL